MRPIHKSSYQDGHLQAAMALSRMGRRDSAVSILQHAKKMDPTQDRLILLNQLIRKPGISVVMPTCMGAEWITHSLLTVAKQTIDPSLFEIIIILNGPEDGTGEKILDFSKRHPNINLQILKSAHQSAGIARNIGLLNVKFDHVTFLDDDDYISERFLSATYNYTDGRSVVFSVLKDDDGNEITESPAYQILLNQFRNKKEIKKSEALDAGTALTMTCIKVFPSYMTDMLKFSPELKNGEDVVLWTKILSKFDPQLILCPPEEQAIYYRTVRGLSVSRQPDSFKFSIADRIAVIRELEKIDPSNNDPFVSQKIFAALSFSVRYLRDNPGKYLSSIEYIKTSGLLREQEILEYINSKIAKNIAISFCFPPWSDTSGVVAAKRLVEGQEATDVISANLEKFRNRDDSLIHLKHPFIGRHIELDLEKPSFSGEHCIIEFTQQSMRSFLLLDREKDYNTLYSRAMWPASHFAAAAIKANKPSIRWTAEFSDPLNLDILSQERSETISRLWLKETGILSQIYPKVKKVIESKSMFAWAEYIAYVLADDIIFTNDNQREYMLSQHWIQDIRDSIFRKSRVVSHPIPDSGMYNIIKPELSLDSTKLNIAYFGNFYKTRGLIDILDAISELPVKERNLFSLYVFTSSPDNLAEEVEKRSISDVVYTHTSVPYFEFLSLCKNFDLLLVNDAKTMGIKSLNPYLPSKLSDYLGSKTPIWALVESGSPMDTFRFPAGSIKSPLGNVDRYVWDLKAMIWKFQRNGK